MRTKQSLLTLAALAACAPAFAQVTISGYVDLSLEVLKQGGASLKRLSSGQLNASRLEFTAKEDLGDGLSAKVRHEMVFSGDTGVLAATSRETYVQLAHKDIGDINLGRLNLASYYVYGFADPSWSSGYSMMSNVMVFYAPWRESNAVSFNSVRMNGFKVSATLTAGKEDAVMQKNGRVTSFAVDYRNGPFYLGLATDSKDQTNIFKATQNESSRDTYLSAVYRIGGAELTGVLHRYSGYYAYAPYVQFRTHGNSLQLGTRVALNDQARLFASVVRRNDGTGALADATGVVVGGLYGLSKRTDLYATYATIHNSNSGTAGAPYPLDWNAKTPLAGENPSGLSVGIRHAF
nr:porin [uncultured Roseateles sp.]